MSKRFLRDNVWKPMMEGLFDDSKPGSVQELAGQGDPDEIESNEEACNSSTGPPYIYSPVTLSGDKSCFRILELLPGERADDICCHLKIYPLDSCPVYEALSYFWGDDKDITPIQIGQGTLHVTKNLRSALRHLRKPSEPRFLWADAVCINQKDMSERTQQVGIMRHIYHNASRTVVWLGLAEDNSGMALSVCAELAKMEISEDKSKPAKPGVPAGNKVTVTGEQESAVSALVLRPWFDRMWVVQEIGVAKDAVVMCGWKELDWKTFSLGIEAGLATDAFGTHLMGLLNTTDFANFHGISTIKSRDIDQSPAEQLLDLLIQFCTRQATDPRDKVFALFGLVDNIDGLHLSPDYHAPANKVFIKVARAILEGSRNLDILGLCPAAPNQDLEEELPSWVPDWGKTTNIPKAFRADAMGRPRTTSASKDSVANPQFIKENKVLVLSGQSVDFIAELGDVLTDLSDPEDWFTELDDMSDDDPDDTSLKGIYRTFRSAARISSYSFKELFRVTANLEVFVRWEKLAQVGSRAPLPTGQTHKAIYWQTLCAGCMPDGYDATEAQFEEWYASLNSVRRLIKLRVNSMPSLFQPLAFAGYMHSTWEQYGKFGGLMAHTSQRRLARSKGGYLCLVPEGSRLNDSIVLCEGGKVPLIARLEDGFWKLVGESYVHGLMNGEGFDDNSCEEMLFK